MNDFTEYKQMKDAGISSRVAYRYSVKKGLEWTEQIRMMVTVYGLSLPNAKEVMVCEESDITSLSEYQKKLFPALKILLPDGYNED